MTRKRVLFLCTGNSCRSQMAEGFLRYMVGDKFEVFSAGVKPAQVNPLAIKIMAEIGIDISKQRSKSATEFLGQKFDYVITICDNAKQTCPAFPGNYEKTHWDLEDPTEAQGSEEERMMVFRKIRDEIEQRIKDWINRC
jgi:arsenate reductase (thioredoxin)